MWWKGVHIDVGFWPLWWCTIGSFQWTPYLRVWIHLGPIQISFTGPWPQKL
mgnify:CR=1 FL=1